MQIHELNNFTGTLGSGAYLAVDDGNDTGKLSTQQLLSATEARIDNIIAGPAPSAEEIVDARLGADGVTYPSLGDAIRDQVSDLKDDLNSFVKKSYHGSPMFLFNEPENTTFQAYKDDGSASSTMQGTRIMKAPNYIAVRFLSTTARTYLYIGDMVGGSFVPDFTNFLINSTSSHEANYFGYALSGLKIYETSGKYFCYKKAVDASNIEIIGFDSLPSEADLSLYTHTTFFGNSSGNVDEGSAKYNGFIIPKGSSYLLDPDEAARFNVIRLFTPVLSPDTLKFNKVCERSFFGYVPDDCPYAILTLGNSTSTSIDFSDVKLYVFAERERPQGYSRAVLDIMDKLRKKSWLCKKKTKWSDVNNRYFNVGEYYYAFPYSSRWKNPHFIGWEVSLETAYNAANDEYSVFYDDTVGRTELGDRGGTGYGLVCSSYASMLMGAKNPQTNFGMTHENTFQIEADSSVRNGECYTDIVSHIVGVNALLENGVVTSELSHYTTLNNVRTSSSKIARALANITKKELFTDYSYNHKVAYRGKQKKPTEFLLDTTFTLANGSVRPWRGNKSVYGSWDKSANGSGIGITIHDSATTAYMVTPSNVTKTYDVTGLTYLDVSADVTESGTYELYSNVSNTKEYFRYYDTSAVTLTFDENGKAIFDNSDVLYCYANASGNYGKGYDKIYERDGGAITFANGAYYPEMVGRDMTIFSAIIADPDDDCWGYYGVVCSYADNDPDVNPDDDETPID